MADWGSELWQRQLHGKRVSQTVAGKHMNQLTHQFQLKSTNIQPMGNVQQASPGRRRRSTSSTSTVPDSPPEGPPERPPESPFSPGSSQPTHSFDFYETPEQQIPFLKNESFTFQATPLPAEVFNMASLSAQQSYMANGSFYAPYEPVQFAQQPQTPTTDVLCPHCFHTFSLHRPTIRPLASTAVIQEPPVPASEGQSSSACSGSSRPSTPTANPRAGLKVIPKQLPCKTKAMQQTYLTSEAARDPNNHHCPMGTFQPEIVNPEYDSPPPPKKRKSQDEFRIRRRPFSKLSRPHITFPTI